MFVRINAQSANSNAVQCGRTPLYLTHDDEMWTPVVLQGKHNDGTVDYEIKYASDEPGGGMTWLLSQEPVAPVYDAQRKCEVSDGSITSNLM